MMSIRIKDLVVPDFADSEEAIAWGSRLTEKHRELVLAARKGLELAALNARHLQDRVDFATMAGLWREAAEAEAIAYPDSEFRSQPETAAVEV